VIGDDRGDQRTVRGQIVGVELPGMHRRGTGSTADRYLLVEPVGGAAARITVAPGASRCASSIPISLRPPRISTGPAPVSSTAAIIT